VRLEIHPGTEALNATTRSGSRGGTGMLNYANLRILRSSRGRVMVAENG
jgi:hypothetical protein